MRYLITQLSKHKAGVGVAKSSRRPELLTTRVFSFVWRWREEEFDFHNIIRKLKSESFQKSKTSSAMAGELELAPSTGNFSTLLPCP